MKDTITPFTELDLNKKNKALVFVENDKAFTDSLRIARAFKKQHKNIVRDIENLDCSAKFGGLNFELTSYTDMWNRKKPKYNITRDGFVFLAMGYTGKKAARFKEAYINAFNRMEEHIRAAHQDGNALVQIARENYEYVNQALKTEKKRNKKLKQKLLLATPFWSNIKYYKDRDLSNSEISRLIGKSSSFVGKSLKKMKALGIKPDSISMKLDMAMMELDSKKTIIEQYRKLVPGQSEIKMLIQGVNENFQGNLPQKKGGA